MKRIILFLFALSSLVANSQSISNGVLGLTNPVSTLTVTGLSTFSNVIANGSSTLSDIVTQNSTALTSTVSGTNWYSSQTTNGFNFYSNDPTNSGFHSTFSNSVNSIGIYLANAGSTRGQFGTRTNVALGLMTNGSVACRISTAGNFAIGSVADQTIKFTVAGTSSITGNAVFDASVGIGGLPTVSLSAFRIVKGTSTVDIGEQAAGVAGLWFNKSTPSTSNYSFLDAAGIAAVNATVAVDTRINGSNSQRITDTYLINYFKTRVGSSSIPTATLDVTGTMSVSSTATIGGVLTTQGQINSTGVVNTALFFQIASGDAEIRGATAGYGLRLRGYNAISGAVEDKFLLQSDRAKTGANYSFSFTPTSFTAQTASTEASGFVIGTATVGHATGAIATHRDFIQSEITHSAIAASVITNGIGAQFNSPIAGTNVTITNPYALHANGNFLVAGKIQRDNSGGDAVIGNATLVGGAVTVNTTRVGANSYVVLTRKTSGGTIGTSITYTISNDVSFTITSDNILDTSTFTWMIYEGG